MGVQSASTPRQRARESGWRRRVGLGLVTALASIPTVASDLEPLVVGVTLNSVPVSDGE